MPSCTLHAFFVMVPLALFLEGLLAIYLGWKEISLKLSHSVLMSSPLRCNWLTTEVKTKHKSPSFINTKLILQTWLSTQCHDSFCDKCLFSVWDIPRFLARSLGLATTARGMTGT